MAGTPTCLVCKKEMEIGFISELGAGPHINIPRWSPGEPKAGLLTEVKRDQRAEGLRVIAYRCPECEALRLYAPSKQ
jgi:hypothetical protein